jgi:hypothetical protein
VVGQLGADPPSAIVMRPTTTGPSTDVGDPAGVAVGATATATATATDRRRLSRWRVVEIVALVAFAAVTFTYVLWGVHTSDEGWYLYAARLVFRGELPYRDFAYTQGPMLPYLYGLPMAVFGPSLLVGRIVTGVWWVATAWLGCRTARRYGGDASGALCALMFLTFAGGTWSFVMTKTYGAIALLMVATAAVLASRLRPGIRYPLAAGLASLIPLVRTSGIAFAAVIVAFCLWQARGALVRAVVVLAAAAPLAVLAGFVALDPTSAKFNLYGYHQTTVAGVGLRDRLQDAMQQRVPSMVTFLALHLVAAVAVVAAVAISPVLRRWTRERIELCAVTAGLVAFALVHLWAGEWHADYALPIVPPLLVLLAAFLGASVPERLAPPTREVSPFRALSLGIVIAIVVLVPAHDGWLPGLDLDHGTVVGQVGALGAFVRDHTAPSDRIFAMEGTSALVDADRLDLPDMSMAEFSYYDAPETETRRYHYVNAAQILRAIETARPDAVVITGEDVALLNKAGTLSLRSGDDEPFKTALVRSYRLAYIQPRFGLASRPAFVWLRR